MSPPPVEISVDDGSQFDPHQSTANWPATGKGAAAPAFVEADGGTISRINLRMSDRLKVRSEQAAAAERLSVNSWLVAAAAAALERTDPGHRNRRSPKGAQRYTGWAR